MASQQSRILAVVVHGLFLSVEYTNFLKRHAILKLLVTAEYSRVFSCDTAL